MWALPLLLLATIVCAQNNTSPVFNLAETIGSGENLVLALTDLARLGWWSGRRFSVRLRYRSLFAHLIKKVPVEVKP